MGKRGPVPKPSALKRLHGDPSHSHPAPKSEPTPPPAGDMSPPAHLGRDAAAAWRRLLPVLRTMGLFTQGDVVAFDVLCSAIGDYAMACRALKRGIVVRGSDGERRRSPWLMVKAKAVEQIKQFAIEFGMTPAARARLGRALLELPLPDAPAMNPAAANDFDAFLASKPGSPAVN